MGHSDGEHELEGDDLSADDSSWSDGVWSEDDDEVGGFFFNICTFTPNLFLRRSIFDLRGMQESLSFEDSGEGSGSDADSDEAAAAEESDSSEDEVKHSRPW